MSVIAYKFQAPNGAYWYIKADDQRSIDYWKGKRKLIALSDDQARVMAEGAAAERDDEVVIQATATAPAVAPFWIAIAESLPSKSGEYWTYSELSTYKPGVGVWCGPDQAWEHDLRDKKRSQLKPKTWVTHYAPIEVPPAAARVDVEGV